jgi:ligand-binding sensor domain-containing protein
MGSNDAGLDRYDGGLYWVHYNQSNSPLPDNNVTNVEMRNDTEVWIATNHGFAILNDTLPSPHVSGMHEPGFIATSIYPNPCADRLYVQTIDNVGLHDASTYRPHR